MMNIVAVDEAKTNATPLKSWFRAAGYAGQVCRGQEGQEKRKTGEAPGETEKIQYRWLIPNRSSAECSLLNSFSESMPSNLWRDRPAIGSLPKNAWFLCGRGGQDWEVFAFLHKGVLWRMKVHLVNPSNMSFGTAVITPRWLYVLAAATPASYGDPHLVDETLESLDPLSIGNGDMVGISIHTGNTLRGYEIGRLARNRGAWVVFGGIHATLYPEESHQLGGAHAVVKGDGDVIWASVLEDCRNNAPRPIYEAGRIGAASFKSARWDLLPTNRYMWASVQTVRGCPKHCSFCSVWRTDGQQPRQRSSDVVLEEIVELRRLVSAS
jgi:hypothetical protein